MWLGSEVTGQTTTKFTDRQTQKNHNLPGAEAQEQEPVGASTRV